MNIYLVIFITLIAALVASFSQLLYKRGLKKGISTMKDVVRLTRNPLVVFGLIGYGASFLIYLVALANSQLSIVYPVFGSTFIFIPIISAAMLKEKISITRAVGIFAIVLGIFLIAATI